MITSLGIYYQRFKVYIFFSDKDPWSIVSVVFGAIGAIAVVVGTVVAIVALIRKFRQQNHDNTGTSSGTSYIFYIYFNIFFKSHYSRLYKVRLHQYIVDHFISNINIEMINFCRTITNHSRLSLYFTVMKYLHSKLIMYSKSIDHDLGGIAMEVSSN